MGITRALVIGIIFSAIYVVFALEKDIPSYVKITRCHRFDPKIGECLLRATEDAREYLVKGIPELGVGSIDPLIIPEVTLEQGTQALNFKARLLNIVVHGLSHYKFSRFDFDVPNLQWFIDGVLDKVQLEGDYNVTGRVLIAPIQGGGKFTAAIDTCNMTSYQKVKVIKRKGLEYVSPILTNTSIAVSGPKVKLDGLFDGNKDLNDITNRVINENINELFQDLKPVIEKVIVEILEKVLLSSLENNVPFDKLYPPIP